MQKLITYYNSGTIPLANAKNSKYTDVILAFLYTTQNAPLTLNIGGGIAAKQSPPELTQHTVEAIEELHSAGKKVHISFGGGQMNSAAYAGLVGSETIIAKSIADFVIQYDLDGIDIDFEDTAAFMGSASYDGVELLTNLTKALRQLLPAPKYTITHAPQPPYLVPGNGMDGYVDIMKNVGEKVDWLNIQFYNNPPWSSNPAEIVKAAKKFSAIPNIGSQKIMVGLPVTAHDAGSGYIPINEIVTEIITPLMTGPAFGGMMNWQFSSDKDQVWGDTLGTAMGISGPIS